jgi:hypothetical protein
MGRPPAAASSWQHPRPGAGIGVVGALTEYFGVVEVRVGGLGIDIGIAGHDPMLVSASAMISTGPSVKLVSRAMIVGKVL